MAGLGAVSARTDSPPAGAGAPGVVPAVFAVALVALVLGVSSRQHYIHARLLFFQPRSRALPGIHNRRWNV